MARWQSCNILDATGEVRQLWQIAPSGDSFKITLEEKKLPDEALPAKTIAKDWQALYQKKLNIAWLPTDKVFLRAIQIPCDNAAEARSMIELQLEKIAPLPANQIVWTFELLPGVMGPLRTALVAVAERNYVEKFLGHLEGMGYLADRLEVPFIDRLQATRFNGDGAYIYPVAGTNQQSCLAAWFYNGLLYSIGFLNIPATEDRADLLRTQLRQMAWAGEVEGWLTTAPRCRLVTDADTAAAWEAMLREVFPPPVEVLTPVTDREIAVLTARRVAAAGPQNELLPADFAARYRQLFIDRIWMRGLGALLFAYTLGALLYLGAVEVLKSQVKRTDATVQTQAVGYTNAMKLKAQIQVMQDQLDLQFAALDCYKSATDLLPEGLNLDSLLFNRGKSLNLSGTAAQEAATKVADFNDALRKAVNQKEQPLFVKVNAPSLSSRVGTLSWNFVCDLKRTEDE